MKTHRPCCWLLLVFSLGILIGHFLPFTLKFWLITSGALILFFFFRTYLWLVYVSLFCLGAALIHVAHPPAMDILQGWRMQLQQSLYHYLDRDEAGTMSAIVLGDRGHIPKEINMVFRHTGTGHILVIAGLHMASQAPAFLAGTFKHSAFIHLCAIDGWFHSSAACCFYGIDHIGIVEC
jgi:hypothetical protein